VLNRAINAARNREAYLRYIKGRQFRPASGSLPDIFEFSKSTFAFSQSPDEVIPFHEFLRTQSPRVICEIGTATGGHLSMLSRSIPTVKKLIGIDLHMRNQLLLRALAPRGVKVTLIKGDSTSESVLSAVRRALSGDQIDVLFIDGDHAYAGVKSDYLMYRPLVRDGGIIAFHDIVEDYETRFGRKTDFWSGDVPRLWKQLKQKAETREFVANPDQDGFGIGVMVHSTARAASIEV
jgi:cephalosporin hydroxylase